MATAASSRCRCCPYGFHIDLEFVSFAEDVSKGNTMKRTPTLPRRSKSGGERNLMSPLDSLFSDSMENIVSDFEEVLGEKPLRNEKITSHRLQNGHQNGYSSDYTVYRSKPALQIPTTPTSNGNRTFALDFNTTPPKPPPHRNNNNTAPTTINNGRSTPTAYTALGRAVSELKARNGAESPFPDREVASRTGTPIDLGFSSNHQTNGHVRRESETRTEVERPSFLPNAATTTSWRREKSFTSLPTGNVITARSTTPTSPFPSDFASLRRGRENAMSDTETVSRSRFFSASPRMPRKMEVAPPLTAASNTSNFTYSHQNGSTILSRTQATCTSPVQKDHPKAETRSAATSTGPLPPAKPCSECPSLRKELKEAIERIPPPPPATLAIGTETEPVVFKGDVELKDANVGESVTLVDAEMCTEQKTFVNRACSPIVIENSEIDTQTDTVSLVENGCQAGVQSMAFSTQTEQEVVVEVEKKEEGVNTDELEPTVETPAKPETSEKEIMTTKVYFKDMRSQTEADEPEPIQIGDSATATDIPSSSESASQTDNEMDSCEPRILDDSEMGDSLWLMPAKETAEVGVETDMQEEAIVVLPSECVKCLEREQTFARNVGVGSCSVNDKICISCDPTIDEVDENDAPGFQPDEKPRMLDQERVAAVKKLLTTEQKQNFVRGTAISRSARTIDRKKGDTLEYIEQKNKTKNDTAPASTPTENTSEALREKVILKKEIPAPPSNLPDPIPAKIPRPKISKYAAPEENAETPDEEDEAADRLTPLRSELRTLNRWPRSNSHTASFSSKVEEKENDSDGESDDSEGSYDTNESGSIIEGTPFEITVPLREALESLNSHLLMPGTIANDTVDWALKYIQHEWTRAAARKASRAENVVLFIEQCKELSEPLLKTVVNITDQNGNTALHYAVSHGNFHIVSCLLDSNDCQLNLANRAGYTAVMLAALSSLEDQMEQTVVQRLFEMGDVNARASQHGQTALMLAVSHGKKAASQLLIECGADVNIQDEEGSTALMCAAEHGHKDLVKMLLSQPIVDAALTDCDNSTALSIAVENGHRDIGVLIYAHLNYVRSESLEESTI